jgi:starvation-inducible DNA-binding protein
MTKAPAKAKTKLRDARVDPPTDLGANAVGDISAALNLLLADAFALYMKTKNFHWHVSGPHFRDFHLMFDEQADQIFGITDEIAERVRKVGGKTIHSIGEIARTTRVLENEKDYVEPSDMVAELRDDNKDFIARLRAAHEVCSGHNDSASTSLIEQWIDDAERRHWFLFETSRRGDSSGH